MTFAFTQRQFRNRNTSSRKNPESSPPSSLHETHPPTNPPPLNRGGHTQKATVEHPQPWDELGHLPQHPKWTGVGKRGDDPAARKKKPKRQTETRQTKTPSQTCNPRVHRTDF